MELPRSYYFLTPVWGDAYTKLFVDIAIPNQLAAGLTAFHLEARYIIFTTQADADTIRSAPVFQELCSVMEVQFVLLDNAAVSTHDRMSACYRRGVAMADHEDAGIVFLTPDMIFAAGSLARIKTVAESGHRAMFVTAIRTLKQQVVAELSHRAFAPRRLMRIALNNLHPLAFSSFWHGNGELLPANLYWLIGNEAILARCFHLHPIYVWPQRKNAVFFGTVDDDFFTAACPDESTDYVVTNSDEFLAIELSDPAHFFHTVYRKGSIAGAAKWAEHFASARHRRLFDRAILLHTGIEESKIARAAYREADQIAAAINERLRAPWYKLLMQSGLPLLGRITRANLDRRLAAANGSDSSFTRLLHACSFWLIDRGIFAIRWSIIGAKTMAKRALFEWKRA